MAFVRLARFPGATERHFRRLADAMGQLPSVPERLVFAAGPVDDGWQIVQIWQEKQALDEFNAAHFLPALALLGAPFEPRRDRTHREHHPDPERKPDDGDQAALADHLRQQFQGGRRDHHAGREVLKSTGNAITRSTHDGHTSGDTGGHDRHRGQRDLFDLHLAITLF